MGINNVGAALHHPEGRGVLRGAEKEGGATNECLRMTNGGAQQVGGGGGAMLS